MNGKSDNRREPANSPPTITVADSPFRLRPIVVGISGATNAGKTTISQRLLLEFPESDVIHQDDFFRVDSLIETARQKFAMLTQSMTQQIKGHVHVPEGTCIRPRLLILEGILVLNIPELFRLMDVRYYMTLTYEECRRRRIKRNYDPADVPGVPFGIVAVRNKFR
ncbi:putative Nicotinamide riboside kinase 1 [Hypsibius exemplaris]|uniref:Nicotinamide riboside kinase 1 n=1 Tax=Hypsibius exemplaris TaxID=2072580 RepID=A0A9X6NEU4_HYPEX|nr:putative Nicotinamide riboside kinase 1 [Hypsibius exemplaris]